MTITKIYISAFGGLKDFTLELNNGFNVVYGNNEDGKTTVMAFIKMMFYGSGSQSKSLSKNTRQKYTPLSGENMAGRIYFEHDGKRYCLEREFKKSNSTDRVTLRNLDSGKSETVEPDVGKRFFGISDAAFERSLFIGRTGLYDVDDGANSEINGKLSNIAATGEENNSYQKILKNIQKSVSVLMKARGGGEYDKGIVRLEELKKELAAADTAAKHRLALGERIKDLKVKLTQTKAEYDKVKLTVDSENDIRKAEKLREYLEVKAELDKLNASLKLSDSGYIDSVFLSKINFCLSKLDNLSVKKEEKSAECEELKKTIRLSEDESAKVTPEQLEKAKQQLQEKQNSCNEKAALYERKQAQLHESEENYKKALTTKKPFNPLLLIAAILLTVSSVLFFIIKLIIAAIPCISLAVIFFVLAFILKPKDTAAVTKAEAQTAQLRNSLAEIKNEETLLQGEINRLAGEMNIMTAALNTNEAILKQRKNDLAEREEQLKQISEQISTAKSELVELYSRYKNDCSVEEIKNSLDELNKLTESQKAIKLRLTYLSKDLGNISYEEAENKLSAIKDHKSADDTDFEAAKMQLEALNEQGVKLSNELTEAATELKSELRDAADPEQIQKEITLLQEKLSHQKEFCDAAMLASEVLEESRDTLRRSYGSVLEKRTLEIFSKLTAGRYKSISVSSSMEMDVESTDAFTTHSVEYLSNGTIDQAVLSLRLALTELMAENEPMPIFLDDVLTQYDDSRTETALKFLKDYSAKTQLVMFTCHGNIRNTAQTNGAEVQNLRN